ncbi:MAG: mannose-6-phosphate isomerase-like protein (cupin superfamily) [Kiritimatiellia bacterium]|jgi:mannose-6-phosphate isomerase-like protein (cupin superfamily)
MAAAETKNYLIERFDEIAPTKCPCGQSRRAFDLPENTTATMHLVEISQDSQVHYHKKMTEIYFILEGEGHLELDGELVPVKPMTAIFIKPGCRHRAVGQLKIINVPVPAFDPDDEWFD